MFSGIVEETGFIKQVHNQKGSIVFSIAGNKTLRGLKVDDSISVNGVCLTVTKSMRRFFLVQAVEETLQKTNLSYLKVNSRVNLERAVPASGRLNGHLVMGHVDTVGIVRNVEKKKSSKLLWIKYPPRNRKYLVPVGSITVDGVSLTIAKLSPASFAVSIIPHTLKLTTLGLLRIGDAVNLEFDVLGKYIENLTRGRKR